MSSPEIMRRIVEAEKEGHRILDQADREIAEAKRNLPSKIASAREQILKEATEERKRILSEAERAGAEDAERIASDSRKQVETLSQIPAATRKRAVERAIELLLS